MEILVSAIRLRPGPPRNSCYRTPTFTGWRFCLWSGNQRVRSILAEPAIFMYPNELRHPIVIGDSLIQATNMTPDQIQRT